MVKGEFANMDEVESLFVEYYLANEALNKKEIREKIQDQNYKYYDYPFYSHVSRSKILEEIEENERELENSMQYGDEGFITFYQTMLSDWELKLKIIEALDSEEMTEIHPETRIVIDDELNNKDMSELTLESIKGLIEVREYASEKYFNRSYLDLYFDATRDLTPGSDKKLEAINQLFKVRIIDLGYAERNGLSTGIYIEEPVTEEIFIP
jgi:hypothetical protein